MVKINNSLLTENLNIGDLYYATVKGKYIFYEIIGLNKNKANLKEIDSEIVEDNQIRNIYTVEPIKGKYLETEIERRPTGSFIIDHCEYPTFQLNGNVIYPCSLQDKYIVTY